MINGIASEADSASSAWVSMGAAIVDLTGRHRVTVGHGEDNEGEALVAQAEEIPSYTSIAESRQCFGIHGCSTFGRTKGYQRHEPSQSQPSISIY